jgi:hypothetical protein
LPFLLPRNAANWILCGEDLSRFVLPRRWYPEGDGSGSESLHGFEVAMFCWLS